MKEINEMLINGLLSNPIFLILFLIGTICLCYKIISYIKNIIKRIKKAYPKR